MCDWKLLSQYYSAWCIKSVNMWMCALMREMGACLCKLTPFCKCCSCLVSVVPHTDAKCMGYIITLTRLSHMRGQENKSLLCGILIQLRKVTAWIRKRERRELNNNLTGNLHWGRYTESVRDEKGMAPEQSKIGFIINNVPLASQ